MKYLNEDLIIKADAISDAILDNVKKNGYRDKFFPNLINALGLKTGVEIGVDIGGFSKHILSKTQMEKYYCVDTWQDNFGSGFAKHEFDKDGNVRYNQAKDNLSEYINSGRCSMVRDWSVDASKEFKDGELDFCYIDGDHTFEGVLLDLLAWVPKVKIGGIISGHDYKIENLARSGIKDYFGEHMDYGVKLSVDHFCRRYGYKVNVVGGITLSWWFIKNKEK